MNPTTIFEQYVPQKFYFHKFQVSRYDDSYTNIFYIYPHKKPLNDADDFMRNSDIVASIQFSTYDDTDEAKITSIHVNEVYRGRGYAYYLCLKVILYLNSVQIETVSLDDDSDNYRKSHNIYNLLGFEYIANAGPEMYADMDTLMQESNFQYFLSNKLWKSFYQKV